MNSEQQVDNPAHLESKDAKSYACMGNYFNSS